MPTVMPEAAPPSTNLCQWCGGGGPLTQGHCQPCYEHIFLPCTTCGTVHSRHEGRNVENRFYCLTCFNLAFITCSCSRITVREGSVTYLGRQYCPTCVENNFVRCIDCDTRVPNDRAQYEEDVNDSDRDRGPLCRQCWDRRNTIDDTTFVTNPFRRRVGIELEFISPTESVRGMNRYGRVKGDGSVHPDANRRGVGREFAAFPARGDALLDLITNVCTHLTETNCYTNASSGFHCHLDMTESTEVQQQNIYKWWQVLERVFLGSVAASRRGNQFCQSTRNIAWEAAQRDRYRTLNISAMSRHSTFECRLHHGTLDADDVRSWALALLTFFDVFGDITAEPERLKQVEAMSDREKLLFLFQQAKFPLSLRKKMLARIKRNNTTPATAFFKTGKKAKKNAVSEMYNMMIDQAALYSSGPPRRVNVARGATFSTDYR